METLALILDGPLQSWGDASQFQRRMTAPHPTKSAVIALLAAAAGIDKHAPNEAEQLRERFAGLTMKTYRLPKPRRGWNGEPQVNRDGSMRWLSVPRLLDYHTVGGGYDEVRQWLSIPRKAERGGVFGTVVTRREYLLDTRFAVFLEGPDDILIRAAADLRDPQWGLWLGRKSCPPATPILGEVHPDFASAWQWILSRLRLPATLAPEQCDAREEVTDPAAGHDATSLDAPLSFGARRYGPRRIRVIRATNNPA